MKLIRNRMKYSATQLSVCRKAVRSSSALRFVMNEICHWRFWSWYVLGSGSLWLTAYMLSLQLRLSDVSVLNSPLSLSLSLYIYIYIYTYIHTYTHAHIPPVLSFILEALWINGLKCFKLYICYHLRISLNAYFCFFTCRSEKNIQNRMYCYLNFS